MRHRSVRSLGQGLILFLVWRAIASAQYYPQQDALDAVLRTAWQANGTRGDISAIRQKALDLLRQMPVTAPRLAFQAQQVAQLYSGGGLHAQARRVLDEALVRITPLGDSDPGRIHLLNALANEWRQDGNLLKAAQYLEQAAAAQAKTNAAANAYINLSNLYVQLGRPAAAAAIVNSLRALSPNDPALAGYYEQHGQIEEAATVLQNQTMQASDPQRKVNAWQALAWFDGRQRQFVDAVEAMQQALAIAESTPEMVRWGQPTFIKQSIADYMRQAGQTGQADQIYQQIAQQSLGQPQESQVRAAYARYLSDTNRAAQGEEMLKNYLASTDLSPPDKMNVLYSLANIVRSTDRKASAAYEGAARALELPAPPGGDVQIGEKVRQTQIASNERRFDDAYNLAMQAIDTAAQAVDGDNVFGISSVASALAYNKQGARADQIFQRLFAYARESQPRSMLPMINVARSYVQYLTYQPDRSGEALAAIDQFRRILIDANGADSGTLIEPIAMRIQLGRSHPQFDQSAAAVRDLLELQESLSGKTSDAYFSDLNTAGSVYQASGDWTRAVALYRQTIGIADLKPDPAYNWRRAQARMATALALAHMGQFDEAEALAAEADKIGSYAGGLQEIESLKNGSSGRLGAATSESVPAAGAARK